MQFGAWDLGQRILFGGNGRVWKNQRGNLRSHFGDDNVLEIHTPLSNFLDFLLGSDLGLPEEFFGIPWQLCFLALPICGWPLKSGDSEVSLRAL